MPKHSAGLLMYRRRGGILEFFLVHPGGPFWARKDDGVWSIPKGELGSEEDPLEAAKREFEEETGLHPSGDYIALSPIEQPSGKIIHAWAFEGNCDPASLRSNTFSLEWPPRSGQQQEFPEVDRAGWFDLNAAETKILRGQSGFLNTLHKLLSKNTSRK
jgi:predicted NUDIX family NTP pyrophosphohydrolase